MYSLNYIVLLLPVSVSLYSLAWTHLYRRPSAPSLMYNSIYHLLFLLYVNLCHNHTIIFPVSSSCQYILTAHLTSTYFIFIILEHINVSRINFNSIPDFLISGFRLNIFPFIYSSFTFQAAYITSRLFIF